MLVQQLLSSPCQSPSVAPTATCLFMGVQGNKKQDIVKGIKILLAICPSSHGSEDLLPYPGFFWNLRLIHVSFLLSFFFAAQFLARWASYHFPCTGVSLGSASTTGTFTELGFCCAWLPPCRGQADIVLSRLNPRDCTIYVRGVCNFISSVSLHQKFQAMDGPVLQLSFI